MLATEIAPTLPIAAVHGAVSSVDFKSNLFDTRSYNYDVGSADKKSLECVLAASVPLFRSETAVL